MPSSNKKNYGEGWGGAEAFEDLECPSGVWCQIRKPNPQQLISLGLIDNLDVLSGLVDKKHIKRVKGTKIPTVSEAGAKEILDNPKAIMDMMAVADKVVEYMVVQPTLRRPVKITSEVNDKGKHIEIPLPFNDRESGVIYTDQLDMMDKMWIFQYCAGGSTDLTTFREQIGQSSSNVGDVGQVENSSV
jgi:hypothetical protein